MTLMRGRTREVYRIYDADEFLGLDGLPLPPEADHVPVPRAASVGRPSAIKLARRVASAAALTGAAGAICWLVAIGAQRSTRGTVQRRPGTRPKATVRHPGPDLMHASLDGPNGTHHALPARRRRAAAGVRIRRRGRGGHPHETHRARPRSLGAALSPPRPERPAVPHEEFGFEGAGAA